ncbi:MAG TPA: hypothetical protein VKA84_17115 [Gemmatimonadaceae bacterium]|nr:hypothetical protein [Gemmatimonadaceae bacterium]
MTTPRTHSLVSLALALTLTLTLAGCASGPARPAWDRPAPADGPPLAIRFDNEAGDYVHVYLVGARRQWLLGRVEAGARATLRIPDQALYPSQGWMRLVVLAGGRASMRAVDEPRAAIAIAQPTAALLSQRWTFARSVATVRLTPLPLGRPRADVRPE